MKKFITILAATAAVSLAQSAYAAEEGAEAKTKVEYKKNGGYETDRTIEHTSPNGTTHSAETNVDVDVDSKGQIDKTVESESSTDPKGLLNSKKDSVKTELEEKNHGGFKQTTTQKHTNKEGTDSSTRVKNDVDVDANGNVTAEKEVKKTVDPKGLMNKETKTSKTKTVNGKVVEDKSEVN